MKKQKGITLIALVITIIVLLILAAVSITALTDEDKGVVTKAKQAAQKTEDASEQEDADIKEITDYADSEDWGEEDELAGTWVLKNSPALPTKAVGVEETSYDLHYEIGGDDTYVSIYFQDWTDYYLIGMGYNDTGELGIGYEINSVYIYDRTTSESQWADDSYKTITITTKLADMENGEEFLTWLKANATKQS